MKVIHIVRKNMLLNFTVILLCSQFALMDLFHLVAR